MNNIELSQYISLRIKQLRKQQNLSQEQLSLKAGLDPKYINKLENLRFSIKTDTLEKILSTLEVSISEFFQFEITAPISKVEKLLQVISELPKEKQEDKIDAVIKLLKD